MNFNSLKITNIPYLNKMFAEDLNEGLKADDISIDYTGKLWWRCEHGHTFERRVSLLNKKQCCPRCERILRSQPLENNIAVTHPEKAKFFDEKKNYPLRVELITHGSNRKVWWKCEHGHESFLSLVHLFVNEKAQCPTCRLESIEEDRKLSVRFPDIAKEWDEELNEGLKASQVTYGSPRNSYWNCSKCGHKYLSPVSARTSNGRGCPECFRERHRKQMISHHRFERQNSIITTHPYLLKLWDKENNQELKPSHVSENSNRQVAWVCPHCENRFIEKPVRLIKTKSARNCERCSKPLY